MNCNEYVMKPFFKVSTEIIYCDYTSLYNYFLQKFKNFRLEKVFTYQK